jgi:hypothetical protein
MLNLISLNFMQTFQQSYLPRQPVAIQASRKALLSPSTHLCSPTAYLVSKLPFAAAISPFSKKASYELK